MSEWMWWNGKRAIWLLRHDRAEERAEYTKFVLCALALTRAIRHLCSSIVPFSLLKINKINFYCCAANSVSDECVEWTVSERHTGAGCARTCYKFPVVLRADRNFASYCCRKQKYCAIRYPFAERPRIRFCLSLRHRILFTALLQSSFFASANAFPYFRKIRYFPFSSFYCFHDKLV